ncbi:hypothetical protein MKZ38_003605 [Zalerion maritima]|uniref:Uncharacterized protein n=1 Tax=Zalerion maritima TaxID=339359 RepID=A0AAD5RMQ1_9PEZI|nr:hypothetical protein MKZ38_003605 [Zalerion maritima]
MEDRAERLRRIQFRRPKRKPWLEAAKVLFRDDAVMHGPPSCSMKDFMTPRLRRCPFDLATLSSSDSLGGGLDGYCWKVKFGDKGPFVLKVFWDTEPPDFSHYFAPQRECQNAALLQMIETAVNEAAATSSPILVNADPETQDDAFANLRAFSLEGRRRREQDQQLVQEESSMRMISSIPRVRKCYGWLPLKTEVFRGKIPVLRPPPAITIDKINRFISADEKTYFAIVYEYIEDEGGNDPNEVQQALDFFRLAGFSHTIAPGARNWKQGVLIDLADIVYPGGFGWFGQLYKPRVARRVLKS